MSVCCGSATVGSGERKGGNLDPFPGLGSALQDGGKEAREGARFFLRLHETAWRGLKLLSFEPKGRDGEGVEDTYT